MQLKKSRVRTKEALEIDSYAILNSDHFHRGKIERDLAQLEWMAEIVVGYCDY